MISLAHVHPMLVHFPIVFILSLAVFDRTFAVTYGLLVAAVVVGLTGLSSSFGALARQYFQYGTWRREVMRRHPETVQARYLAPPVAVAAIGVGVAAGITGLVVPSAATLRLGWLIPGGYAAAVALGGIAISRGESRSVRARVPAVLAAMHLSWGVGFLTSRPQTGGKS